MSTSADDARFQYASDCSLLVYFGHEITLEAHHRVLKLLRLLESQPLPGVRNLHPAYHSVLIDFDPRRLHHDQLERVLAPYVERVEGVALPESRLVEIPACYGGEHGPDLREIAELHAMKPADVIELHASVSYRVYFLGFVPGFAYLGNLPPSLATPRLAVPRRRVSAGSVGIAGTQTGVYPFSTPGGWRLIARTPIEMFARDRANISLLAIGDRVRFVPISPERFASLAAQ